MAIQINDFNRFDQNDPSFCQRIWCVCLFLFWCLRDSMLPPAVQVSTRKPAAVRDARKNRRCFVGCLMTPPFPLSQIAGRRKPPRNAPPNVRKRSETDRAPCRFLLLSLRKPILFAPPSLGKGRFLPAIDRAFAPPASGTGDSVAHRGLFLRFIAVD